MTPQRMDPIGRPASPGAWFASTDHRRVALSFLAAVAFALTLGGTFSVFLRVGSLGSIVDADTFARLAATHGVVMVLLCMLPVLPSVFGNALLPAAVGASTLAFPGLTRAAWRLYALALLAAVGMVVLGSVDVGWAELPRAGASASLAALAVAMHLLALSLVCTGINHVVTVARAVGEVPLLARAMAAAGVLQLLAAPVLGAAGLLLLFTSFGSSAVFGLSADVLFDFVARSVLGLVLVPAVGLLGTILANAARKEPHAPLATTVSAVAVAVLVAASAGLDTFAGEDSARAAVASFLALLSLVPSAVLVVHALATLHRGAVDVTASLLLALVALVDWCAGGLAGLFLSALSTASHLQGTTFSTGQLHYLLAGGGLATVLAALYEWWPAMTGRVLDERLGKVAATLAFVGAHLAFLPQLVAGAHGLAVRTRVPASDGIAALVRMSSFGGLVLLAALIVAGTAVVRSLLAPPMPTSSTARAEVQTP